MRTYRGLVVGREFHDDILGIGRRALHQRDFRLARSVSRLLAVEQGDCANRTCNACPLAPDCLGVKADPASEYMFWGRFTTALRNARQGSIPRESVRTGSMP